MSVQQLYAEDPSLNKLLRIYGEERANTLVQATMREIGVDTLQRPEDRLRFGAALMKKGGLLEAIGRAIRIQAILQGARDV